MRTVGKPITALTAADLMSRDVVVLPQHLSLRAAAQMLSRSGVSGAPVIDNEGACVGVLSATDFVHWANDGPRPAEAPCECVCADWQMVEPESLPADAVSGYMTRDLVTASPLTGACELARMMLDAHVHRVVIVDERERPVGIVSSTDLLAAVAYGPGPAEDAEAEGCRGCGRHEATACSPPHLDRGHWSAK